MHNYNPFFGLQPTTLSKFLTDHSTFSPLSSLLKLVCAYIIHVSNNQKFLFNVYTY